MRTNHSLLSALVLVVLCTAVSERGLAQSREKTPSPTTLVVLGVSHTGQLVAESYRPAVFRAFFDQVDPAAIGVERDPEAFARGDHYAFTYEIQNLTVPYARAHGIPVYPIDWVPPVEDQLLAYGVNLEEPPFLRRARGFRSFTSFSDSAALERSLFWAGADTVQQGYREWYSEPAEPLRRDFARRLFLYRTFLQAERIAAMAADYRGDTVLVVIGAAHKEQIERILGGYPEISIVQPSTIGVPSSEQVGQAIRTRDLFAIAYFNLLGVQPELGVVDWEWVRDVVSELEERRSTSEVRLLRARLRVLTGRIGPEAAVRKYARIRETAPKGAQFTWSGVKDESRVDSHIDPFGNLSVRQRAALELARELYKMGRASEAEEVQDEIAAQLSTFQRHQLLGYWEEYVIGMK